jgi:hypothetical protein
MIRSVTRLKVLTRHPRMLLPPLAAVAFAVTLAACGSSGGAAAHPAAPKPAGVAHSHAPSTPAHATPPAPPATTPPAPPATTPPATTPPAPPATAPAPTANPIPQGNGGDHDADNNGAPSDGDGNM